MLSRGILLDVALARIEILEGRNAGDQRKLIDAVAAALSEALNLNPPRSGQGWGSFRPVAPLK